MRQPSKKPVIKFRAGSVIKGRWHKQTYDVVRHLGQGAIGSVYLCKRKNGDFVALKVSEKGASITTEVNVLKQLSKVQGKPLGPSLFDVDDIVLADGVHLSFYVMEYVKGKTLPVFIQDKGTDWIGVFLLQLLSDLDRLHRHGWIFGDLKLDNVIVTDIPPKIRWIDVGGTTQIGRSIKEYTEFYDRGYWQLGTRKAEPSYDLFAMAMMVLHIAYPKQFTRDNNPKQMLIKKIRQANMLVPYQSCLEKAITGSYQTSIQMKKEVNAVILRQKRPILRSTATSRQSLPSQNKVADPLFPFLETIVIAVISMVCLMLSYF